MHIAIDARAYYWTGIGRYIRNLLQEYAALGKSHMFTILVPKKDANDIQKEAALPAQTFRFHPVEASYYSWREQTVLLRDLYALNVDLVHFTHFNVPVFFRRPYVVTIHDITRFIFPGQKRQRLLEQIGYEFVFSNAVKHARAVICVSKATQEALVHLPVHSAPTSVVYEGVEERFLAPIPQSNTQKIRLLLGSTDPYLLYVGVWMSHKNLVRLLHAFRNIHSRHPNLKLVITGKPVPGYIDVVAIARKLELLGHVIFPGFVPENLLPALYGQSVCLVFPSLYEGFGLPALEAAASGTSIITSNVTSMSEVMGHAALYVNPEDTESITNGLETILSSKSTRDKLIAAGKAHARQFSWRNAALQTLQIYSKALYN